MKGFFPTFNDCLSTLLKPTYSFTINVGRKEMRREWEKKSKRRELGRNKWINQHWNHFHSEERFGEKEIELKPSPCLPNLIHCPPVILAEGALDWQRGHSMGWGASSAPWLFSSWSAPCFQLQLHLHDRVLGVGPHTSFPTRLITEHS